MEKRKHIISQIEGMKDSRYYCVLYYRYVLGVPLERLTTRMDYTWRNIRYLHKAALKKFEEMYLNDSNCGEAINEK